MILATDLGDDLGDDAWPSELGIAAYPNFRGDIASPLNYVYVSKRLLVRASFSAFFAAAAGGCCVCPGMSGNLRPRLASSSSSSPFRMVKTTTRCVLMRRSARHARIQWSSAASGSRAIPMYPASNAGRAWKSSPKRMSLGSARSAACRTRGVLSGLSAPSDRRKKFPADNFAKEFWPKKFRP